MERLPDGRRTGQRVAKYTMAVTVSLTQVEAYRIRRYERFGLLRPRRTGGHQRLFSDVQVELIREIHRLEGKGINLEGVRAILAIREGEEV